MTADQPQNDNNESNSVARSRPAKLREWSGFIAALAAAAAIGGSLYAAKIGIKSQERIAIQGLEYQKKREDLKEMRSERRKLYRDFMASVQECSTGMSKKWKGSSEQPQGLPAGSIEQVPECTRYLESNKWLVTESASQDAIDIASTIEKILHGQVRFIEPGDNKGDLQMPPTLYQQMAAFRKVMCREVAINPRPECFKN